ncbi:hypothetical protein [Pseudosulfitobacter pseudonitzschiae]|uniref:hypothetical protein n=1 Tax=Pseudosulfitobacter pseudonitzschiae TaxID=1402135 RepID=UPI003B7BFE61
MEDETHSGGDWEHKNSYWLTGRRTCFQQFSSWEEIEIRSKRHIEVIDKSDRLTREFEEAFHSGGTAQEARVASRTETVEGE